MPSRNDIFAEEDGYVPGIGRKRHRFSFPSSEWRLLDEPDDQVEDNVGNGENWFDSDEELLDRDEDVENDEALSRAAVRVEKFPETVPITSSMEDVASDRVQHVESDTPVQEALFTYSNAQEIQTIAPSSERTAVEPNFPDTQPSLPTPRLHPITSSALPTPSPLVQTPVDSAKASQGPSSGIPTSQPHFSHPQFTETIHHDDNLNVSSDVYKTGVQGDMEVYELDIQTRDDNGQDVKSKLRSEHLAMDTLEVIRDEGSLQGVHGHFSSSAFIGVSEFDLEQGGESRGARDADDLASDLIQDDRVEQSGGEPMGAYDSVFEDGAEADSDGSEFEGAMDDETCSQVQIIEVDDTSPGGYGKRGLNAEEAEGGESDFEDRDSSDEAEEAESEEDAILSEQSEYSDTGSGYEEESADEDYRETLTSRTPQRIVHPEVIVLDSDSEDEPPKVNAPSSMHSNSALSDTGSLSHHEDNEDEIASQDIDHMEEDRDAYSDEEEEEDDQDMLPSETRVTEYENAGHKYMHTHEVYDLDERGDAQAEDTKEYADPTSSMDEILSLPGDLGGAQRQLDTMIKVRPSATSDTFSVDNDIMTREAQENSILSNMEEIPDEDSDFDVKDEQSPIPEDQTISQEQSTGSARIMQRLAYRTVSPAPVPNPLSIVNDDSQYTNIESTAPTSIDHGSSSDSKIDEAEVNHDRRRRWIDGSDERHLQEFGQQVPKEEHFVHGLTDEDEGALENLDEVILIEDYSIGPTENESREAAEVAQPDLQVDLTSPPIVETPELPVYATLAMLGEWSDEAVDVIAVAVDVSPAESSTTKTEEYHMRLRVTDISMAGTTVIVEIVQPFETSLPRVTEGDVLLLHAFQAQTHNDSIELLSSNDSGWAVISPSADHPRVTDSNVTFGEREHGYVKLLQSWFREDGAAMAADHMLQLSISQEEKQPSPFSAASSDAGSLESTRSGPVSRRRPRRKRGHRRVTIHELRDGRRYTEFGWLDSDSIHELRDGTVYAHSFDRDR